MTIWLPLLLLLGIVGLTLRAGGARRVSTLPGGATASHYVLLEVTNERPLNAQVWQHEREARSRGLVPVVEIFASSGRLSAMISQIWQDRSQFVADTLAGIYLLRVDLGVFGPQAVLGLTPHALHGVPVFVAWNEIGQMLTPGAFGRVRHSDVELTLSAYFKDVAEGVQHHLHPPPPLPVLALALRRAAELPDVRRLPQPSSRVNSANEHPEPAHDAPHPAVQQLADGLLGYLLTAQQQAVKYLEEKDLRSDCSLHSLRQLDLVLDEDSPEGPNPDFIGAYLAALGVYFGNVLCRNAGGEWFVDLDATSPLEALCVRLPRSGGSVEVVRPTPMVLERIGDPEVGLYGQAVVLCGSAQRPSVSQ